MRWVCRVATLATLAPLLLVVGPAAQAAPPPGRATPAPMASAAPSPVPTPATSPSPGTDRVLPPGTGEQPALTTAQLSAQVAAAGRLRADLVASGARVATATARITQLSRQSAAALTQLSAARATEAAARAEAVRQLARFRALDVAMQADQDSVGRWAHDAYVNGGPLADYVSLFQLLTSRDADQAADPLAILQYVAAARGRALDRLQGLTAAQQDAADRAERASRDALSAATRIAAAKARLDHLLADQRSALVGLERAEADQLLSAGSLRGALLRSHDPAARAADELLRQALRRQDLGLLTDTGTPCHADTRSYPNGAIPASALCPLYAAPGQSLRPDPARAFNAMSRAFQHDTGRPLCVTDSYRSYAGQVAVAITRRGFAAVPGTSNHGLGMAVDLCGGVESFGTAAHVWMDQHAALYGWFHPAWSEPGGVLPEPWHWEFAD